VNIKRILFNIVSNAQGRSIADNIEQNPFISTKWPYK